MCSQSHPGVAGWWRWLAFAASNPSRAQHQTRCKSSITIHDQTGGVYVYVRVCLVARHVFYWVGCVEEAGVKIISRGMQVRRKSRILSLFREKARARATGRAQIATRARVAVGEPAFRNVVTHGPSFWAELWLRRNSIAQSARLFPLHPPRARGPAGNVAYAWTGGRASHPTTPN